MSVTSILNFLDSCRGKEACKANWEGKAEGWHVTLSPRLQNRNPLAERKPDEPRRCRVRLIKEFDIDDLNVGKRPFFEGLKETSFGIARIVDQVEVALRESGELEGGAV